MWLCIEPNDFRAGATSHTPLLTVFGSSGFLPVMSYFSPVSWASYSHCLKYPLAHPNGFDECIEAANCCTIASNCIHAAMPKCAKLESNRTVGKQIILNLDSARLDS